MPQMQGEFAANARKRQDGICPSHRVGTGAAHAGGSRNATSENPVATVTTGQVSCKKRLDLLDCKAVDVLADDKRRCHARNIYLLL